MVDYEEHRRIFQSQRKYGSVATLSNTNFFAIADAQQRYNEINLDMVAGGGGASDSDSDSDSLDDFFSSQGRSRGGLDDIHESTTLSRIPQSYLSKTPKHKKIKPTPVAKRRLSPEQKCNIFWRYIYTDFWNNLTIVTLPAVFTNFVWRLMNLYGVAVSHNPRSVIYWTVLEIATVVFVLCVLIDFARQMLLHYQKIARHQMYTKYPFKFKVQEAFANYQSPQHKGYLSTFNLGVKFFCAVVFWTIGYEMVAEKHQIYVTDWKATDMFVRWIMAGVGSIVGLLIAGELIVLFEYYIFGLKGNVNCNVNLNRNTSANAGANASGVLAGTVCGHRLKSFWFGTNQRGIFGVCFKGFWEGFVWALIGDMSLYLLFSEAYGMPVNGSKLLDAWILGIGSGLAFSFAGILLSMVGCVIDRKIKSVAAKDRNREENDDDVEEEEEEYDEDDADWVSDGNNHRKKLIHNTHDDNVEMTAMNSQFQFKSNINADADADDDL